MSMVLYISLRGMGFESSLGRKGEAGRNTKCYVTGVQVRPGVGELYRRFCPSNQGLSVDREPVGSAGGTLALKLRLCSTHDVVEVNSCLCRVRTLLESCCSLLCKAKWDC